MNVIRLIKDRESGEKCGEKGIPVFTGRLGGRETPKVQVQKLARVKTEWILTPGGTAVLGFAVKHT